MMHLFRFTWVIGPLFLLGCASKHSAPPSAETTTTPPPVAVIKKTRQLSSWEIQGLMAVKSPKKSFSANLIWLQQGPHHYHLRLMGPFGNGTVLINRQGENVTYQDDHTRITAPEASSLLYKKTGVRLPVDALYHWIKGLPTAAPITQATYDKQHHLLTLQQQGYILQYASYESINGYALPKKITLNGHHLMVKLIIKHWQLS